MKAKRQNLLKQILYSNILHDIMRMVLIIIIAQFAIFIMLYTFESNSVLLRFGDNVGQAYFQWLSHFLTFDWGKIYSNNLIIVPLRSADNEVGLLSYVGFTLLYGFTGILIAVVVSTLLSYSYIFNHSEIARRIGSVISLISGFHIIIFCYILKVTLNHQSGFHILLPISIGIGSYMYADITNYQHIQFRNLKTSDFMVAARAFGDSEFVHVRRSIILGLLSEWNTLVGTMFANTVLVEIFFKIKGVGFAIERYLIRPNLRNPSLNVESEFFMSIATVVILVITTLSLIKTVSVRIISKGFRT